MSKIGKLFKVFLFPINRIGRIFQERKRKRLIAEKGKIYKVYGYYSNGSLSRMINYGDNYGEPHSFTEEILAHSEQDAISEVSKKMKSGIKDYNNSWKEFRETVKRREEKQGTPLSQIERKRIQMLWFMDTIFEPNIPTEIEDWKAEEIKIPGHTIIVQKNAPKEALAE